MREFDSRHSLQSAELRRRLRGAGFVLTTGRQQCRLGEENGIRSMGRITSIERQRRGGWIAVMVEGEPWASVHREAVYALGLRVGQEASDDLRAKLERED